MRTLTTKARSQIERGRRVIDESKLVRIDSSGEAPRCRWVMVVDGNRTGEDSAVDGEWLTLERAKWEYITLVVASSRSLAQAARRLGLHARSLRRMLQKLPPPR